MNYSSYRITLNNYDTSSQIVLNAKQGDTGRKLYISLTDGSLPYEIEEGCKAVFTADKPDGNVIYNDCEIENNTIIYTMTEQTTAAVGFVACEIKLYDKNDVLLITPRFGLLVEKSVFNDQNIPESGSEFTAISEILVKTVNQYMQENPVATDATFTKANWAADAEAVGKALAQKDAAISAAQKAADSALPKSGGAMSGYVTIPHPVQNTHPATKKYVDDKHQILYTTLKADGWQGESAPYTQSVDLEGITGEDNPHYTAVYSGDINSVRAQKAAFSLVDKLETAENTVTFTCFDNKPEVDLVIQMEVNR